MPSWILIGILNIVVGIWHSLSVIEDTSNWKNAMAAGALFGIGIVCIVIYFAEVFPHNKGNLE